VNELCGIFKHRSFLLSKYVRQCLQTASAPTETSPLDLMGDGTPDQLDYSPSDENFVRDANWCYWK